VKNLNELARTVHSLAREKGWYETSRTQAEICMLMVSELAEATEEVRKRSPSCYFNYGYSKVEMTSLELPRDSDGAALKPEGELIELADCAIRALDWAGSLEMNLEETVSNVGIDDKSALSNHLRMVGFISMIALATQKDHQEKLVSMFLALIEKYTQSKGWDLESAISLKHEFNKSRSYRHGDKAL
jgi:hypothetical protein